MIIGIDAHNLEGKRTGVGRYVLNLLKEWSRMDLRQFYHTTEYDRIVKNRNNRINFILYFKNEIPADFKNIVDNRSRNKFGMTKSETGCHSEFISESCNFEYKLLNVRSTAKFMNWDLARAAKKDKVDILFCPDYRAPIFYRGKTAITLHDISYEAHPEWFNWPSQADRILLKWASKKTSRHAQIIFAPTEFVKSEIIKYYGIAPIKIIVTPLGVDPALYDGKKFDSPVYGTDAIDKIKKKYGIKDRFVFYVGSIFFRRHLPEIIEAFVKLYQENVNSPHPNPPLEKGREKFCGYQLLIGGKDYTDNKSVDKLVKETNNKLGREAILRVDFIADDELKLLYSAGAFFIWLSDYEGFGLPPLEAMRLGAPVITTEGTSLSEVAGEAALLIRDNSDVKEIFRAMHKLTRDNILRDELIARGKEQVKKFSWQECAEKTLGGFLSI